VLKTLDFNDPDYDNRHAFFLLRYDWLLISVTRHVTL